MTPIMTSTPPAPPAAENALIGALLADLQQMQKMLTQALQRVEDALVRTSDLQAQLGVATKPAPFTWIKKLEDLAKSPVWQRAMPKKRWLVWLIVRDAGPINTREVEKKLKGLGLDAPGRDSYNTLYQRLKELQDEHYIVPTRREGTREVLWCATGKQPLREALGDLSEDVIK